MPDSLRKPIHTMPPMTAEEVKARFDDGLDFVYICGDAYIDHPSFGAAIIARTLQEHGFSVGIIAQPDWNDISAFRRLGRPKLAFLVSSGNIDSMVNHYTVMKKRRNTDAYTPGGRSGARPDRAVIVYANKCREAFSNVPVLIGGIEASLRRFAHYDYWDNRVRHSILYDSGADLLMYGMGERSIVSIAERLDRGIPVTQIRDIPGTCYRANDLIGVPSPVILPCYTDVASSKETYAEAVRMQLAEQDPVRGKYVVQAHEKGYLIQTPPQMPLTTEEMDATYSLPYSRAPHPSYKEPIPALQEVEFSVTSSRGCFGSCNFCALTFHQGRIVSSRSHESIISEVKTFLQKPNFKGYVHDVGGPTANFRLPACAKQLSSGTCADRSCIGFSRCGNLKVSHSEYVALLKKLRNIEGIKKVFIRSGVRFDYLMYDEDKAFLRELVGHHISGQLKVAPEHISDKVLYYMNKPRYEIYRKFVQEFEEMNTKLHKQQYLVPYLMSSHPGCTLNDAVELALYIKRSGHKPEQVQDFYPTPGTVSTCMYWTGIDPRTGKKVYVARSAEEKTLQRALIQYYLPENYSLVRKALQIVGREDLIGYERNSLVPPAADRRQVQQGRSARRNPKETAGQQAGKKKQSARKRGKQRRNT